MKTRALTIDGPLDLRITLAPTGTGRDGCRRTRDGSYWRLTWTPDGAGAMQIIPSDDGVEAAAWGDGADWLLERLPNLVGADDDPTVFAPTEGKLYDLHRRHVGLRMGRTERAVDVLIRAIPAQRVTAKSARRSSQQLNYRYGGESPGPAAFPMPPNPDRIAELSYAELHSCGLERTRAATMIEVCRRRNRIEALSERGHEAALEALMTLRGIGPWTANRVADVAWGWSDAVETGDYWLPSLVSWLLAGEARAEDPRMLELLEPYRPHRARAVRLLMAAHVKPPRFGPRLDVRDFRDQ